MRLICIIVQIFYYNKMIRRQTFIQKCPILLVLALIYIRNTLAASIDFTANQRYSYVGQCVVNIETQTLIMGSTNWDSVEPTITITLPQSLATSNISKIDFSASIGQFQTYSLSKIDVFIFRYNLTQTQILFVIGTSNSNLIKRLTINYLLYQRESQYNPIFQIATINYYFGFFGTSVSSNPSTFVYLYTNITYPLNQTTSFNALVMISGLSAIYNINNVYDISLSSVLLNSTHTKTTIQSKSSQYTIIYRVLLRIIIYKQTNSSNWYRFYHGTIVAQSGNIVKYNSSSHEMASINTIVGLTSFSLYYQYQMSFSVTVNQSMGVVISAVSPFSSSNSLTFTYLIIQSYYCDYKNPFLQQTSKMCYSSCPYLTTSNNKSLTCQCLINGGLANNSICLQNNNSINSTSYLQDKSSSSSIGIIIGTAIGSIIIISIFIFIGYKYWKKTEDKSSSLTNLNQLHIQIKFDKPIDTDFKNGSMTAIYQHPIISSQAIHINQINVQQPQYYSQVQNKKQKYQQNFAKEEVKQYQKQKIESNMKRQQIKIQWIQTKEKYSSQQICCTCLQKGTFLQSSCYHSFHLTHLFQWIKKKNTCPNCRSQFNGQFKYFCNVCCLKYRIVKLNQLINQKEFQRICGDCPV